MSVFIAVNANTQTTAALRFSPQIQSTSAGTGTGAVSEVSVADQAALQASGWQVSLEGTVVAVQVVNQAAAQASVPIITFMLSDTQSVVGMYLVATGSASQSTCGIAGATSLPALLGPGCAVVTPPVAELSFIATPAPPTGTSVPATLAPGTSIPGTSTTFTLAPGTSIPGTSTTFVLAPGTSIPGTSTTVTPVQNTSTTSFALDTSALVPASNSNAPKKHHRLATKYIVLIVCLSAAACAAAGVFVYFGRKKR
jgi:hypothetical protein